MLNCFPVEITDNGAKNSIDWKYFYHVSKYHTFQIARGWGAYHAVGNFRSLRVRDLAFGESFGVPIQSLDNRSVGVSLHHCDGPLYVEAVVVEEFTAAVAETELLYGGVNCEDVFFCIVCDAVSDVPVERK